ncbi:MAG: transcription termination factor Rho [Planctomycetes bacterium]|nr:transcription termination factor Rho [Planctomycetota bacterium]
MAKHANPPADDVVFQDEGSFYDPDDQDDDGPVAARGSGGHDADDAGDSEGSSDSSDQEGTGGGDSQPGKHRRRRRRRRSRKGGEGTAAGGSETASTPAPAPAPAPSRPEPRQHQGRGGQNPRHRRGNDRRGGGGSGGNGGGDAGEGNDRDASKSLGVVEGILELHPKGYGFLRDPKNNYASGKNDPFVPASLIEKNKLREGLLLRGEIVHGHKGQGPRFRTIEAIDGRTPEEYTRVRPFDELTAVNPFERIRLETGTTPITMRVMDLLTPLGKGQRALIVAPPRTGKTMLLQEIANSVSTNHPEMHLIVLLIDERPEEVTEMRRRVRGEVIASSMDRDVESHVRISQLIIERGKRLAEAGKHVFILLDSITRTARAFNKWVGNTGRTMSGGLDVKALDIPKKMFGTARRFDEGGSLTVVATALIDTGSRMDEVIFQEFKGTGNMELVLNRQLADRRVWPAIDIGMSGTRREELILTPEELDGIIMLRRSLVSLNPIEAMEQLVKTLARFPTNREFLTKIRAIL